MDLETKRLDGANAHIHAKPSLEVFEEKSKKVAQKIARNTKIDGFRRGKVPLNVIQQRYQDRINEETRQELLDSVLHAGVKALELAPQEMMGSPAILKFEKQDTHFDIELRIGIKPHIDLSSVESCIPDFTIDEISQAQVQERLDILAKEKSSFSDAPENTLVAKDHGVIIDFEGLLDGQPFEGNKAQNFALIVGEGRLLEDFETQLIGMRVDEEKQFVVRFPKDYANATLADKEVSFHVKLHQIQIRQIPEIDDAFVKAVLNQEKEPTLELLRQKIKDQLFLEAKTKLYNQELKDKLMKNLEDTLCFDLPTTLLEQEIDLALHQSLQDTPQEELEELQKDPLKLKEKRESFRAEALKSVRVTFIIEALSRQEKIEVQDSEVFQVIYHEAMMTKQDPKQLIAYYEKNYMLPAVKMTLIGDKLLTCLLDKRLAKAQEAS
ncbi:trigger factor [Helicobacter baculiformis]|uniref:Trigger factor n=1 Tax=Helicobacter baculiformis TaxID=427351 RepID=A0ABV7ZJM7_9HELI|nr:trigger factor [Helicobacter baculiformis]